MLQLGTDEDIGAPYPEFDLVFAAPSNHLASFEVTLYTTCTQRVMYSPL